MNGPDTAAEPVFSFGVLVITDTVVMTWVIMAVTGLAAWLISRRLRLEPGPGQTAIEGIVVAIENAVTAVTVAPKHTALIMPFIGTLWIFLVVANLVGLIPGLQSPTRDLSATAALAVHRLLVNGQRPELGPILVTGASGGVGAISIAILAKLGFDVAAVSGKPDLHAWLRDLGAAQILGRDELPGGDRPLEKGVWGGAVDNVGGDMLARITRTLVPYGNIASIGNAGGIALETTVMPFILRGVALLGCDSVHIPQPLRGELWQHLATDWRVAEPERLLGGEVTPDALPEVFERMLAGRTHGRVLVSPSPSADAA